jgi:acetyltransferase-like isoleucine patch superfamily enzyme
VARPAVTPPPSPEYKESRSQETISINREHADDVDEYAITTDTPPPSRKSSLLKLKLKRPEPTPVSNEEHDPAITNPFIVNAPYVKPPCYIDYGTNLHVGAGTFINRNFMVIDSPVCQIRIGDRCLFGPNVILAAVEHPLGEYNSDSRACSLGNFVLCIPACT